MLEEIASYLPLSNSLSLWRTLYCHWVNGVEDASESNVSSIFQMLGSR